MMELFFLNVALNPKQTISTMLVEHKNENTEMFIFNLWFEDTYTANVYCGDWLVMVFLC